MFTSDAAGAPSQTVNGIRVIIPSLEARGVASISLDEKGQPWFASRLVWPSHFLSEARDSKGSFFGAKSTTLEMIGLLLPFLTIPKCLAGRHITLQVDNIAVIFGWQNKQIAGDISASILVRGLYLITAYLECLVYVKHLPRLSSREGELADHLSRESSTSMEEEDSIRGIESPVVSKALTDWLNNPVEDWDLAVRLLKEVKYNHNK